MFNSYKTSYNRFYKKKLFDIKFTKFFNYVINKKVMENKDTLIEELKEGLLDDNPYFDTSFKQEEADLLIKVYLKYFKLLLFDISKRPHSLFDLKKNYSFLRNKKLKRSKIRSNIKNKKTYLQTFLNDYCNQIIKSNKLDNYYNTQYFQLHNKFLLYKKHILNKSNMFIKKF